jgi:hypothetical protein
VGLSKQKIATIAALTSTIWPSIASSQAGGAGGLQQFGGTQGYQPPAGYQSYGNYQPYATAGRPLTYQQAGVAQAYGLTRPAQANTQSNSGQGGLQVDFGFSTSLRIDDNFQLNPKSLGTSYVWDNTGTFAINKATQTQTLLLTGSGVLRFADYPGRTVSGFEDPTLRFLYSTDSKNSSLTVDARYRNADREYLDPFQVEQEEQNSGSFYGNGGNVTYINGGILYQTGLYSPFGATFGLRHDEKLYKNVTNPQLFNNQTDTGTIGARFDVSPVTQLNADATVTWYTAEDTGRTDRNTVAVTAGVLQDINPVLLLNAQLGYTTIATTKSGVKTNQDGLTADIGLTQTLDNGAVNGNFNLNQTVNGTRTTLQFGRTFQTPTGNFAGTLGLTHLQSGSTEWIGSVAYSRQLKSSNFIATLSRNVSTNSADDDVLDTRVGFTYGYVINSVSQIDVNFNWGLSENGGAGTVPTVYRTNITAAYTRALTQDWNLTGGITYRYLDDSSNSGPANSNAIFVSLGRNFSFRP